MLENASQHIACDFDVSQEFWNTPSQVCSIAACGWAYRPIAPDFGIAQPFIIRFSNGFQHCNDDLMSFPVICAPNSSIKYF